MTTCTVFVMRNQLEPGLHLEFHQVGSTERSSVSTTDSERWLALALVPMTVDYLRKYVTDARAAAANLAATGFHVVQIGAQVVPFPQPHRRTA